MSLETDIQQTVFRNDRQKVIINLVYTNSWLDGELNDFFRRFDITQQQFNILRILRGAGKPMSTCDIRSRLLYKMSDSSRIVDRLVIKGLVDKCVSETDQRRVDVSINAKGKKFLDKVDKSNSDLDDIVTTLNPSEIKVLNKLLDKLRKK